MSAPVRTTKLGKLHTLLCNQLIDILENGVILEDKDGCVVMGKDGEPLRRRANAAELNTCRQLLKDHNIDEEPVEGSEIVKVAKCLPKFDDEPLYIPERDGVKLLPGPS